MYRYLLLALLVIPNISFASVKISEIAWMGTANSSTDEWIELYNDGQEEVSLSGYSLVSLDEKLKINLKGSIAANSYYLIERTDDNSVPNITADLVASFSSGLSNAGETLRILNSDGSIVDEVVGGTDWKNIGGNSTTKNTPQLVDGVWVVGTPTPKAVNSGTVPSAEENANTTTSVTSVSSVSYANNTSSNTVKKIRDTYKIIVSHEGSISKDIPEKFNAKVLGFDDEELKYADIKWNFGDGVTAEGKEVFHTYKFEGVYPVVVSTSYNGIDAEVKIKTDVLAQDIKITDAKSGGEGYIKLKSNIDTDISGYYLYDGNAKFVFPKDSMLYAKTVGVYANMFTGIVDQKSLALYQADGKLISAFGDSEKVIDTPVKYSYYKKSAPLQKDVALSDGATSDNLLAAVNKSEAFPTWAYWLIAFGFISLALLIIYLSKIFNKDREIEDEAAKYTLVEIDSNLE